MLLVLAWKPIGMQPESMTIKAQQASDFMLPPREVSLAACDERDGAPRAGLPLRSLVSAVPAPPGR